jgi:hypothetical protein
MSVGAVALAFVAGVLTSLSPCVLPILPLVLGAAASEREYGPVALAAGLAISTADLLRLHAGLEGLGEIGRGDPNDDLPPGVAGHVGHLRKMLVSFAAQLFSRGALVGR